MIVLFVYSGNSGKISPILENQANSLVNQGLTVKFYPIIGKGLKGYLSNILPFREYIKQNKINIIHAHYLDSALVPTLSFTKKPIIVSLMGSDVYDNRKFLPIIRFFIKFYWKDVIVKSEKMKGLIKISSLNVIPNGVNFQQFYPQDQAKAKEKIGFNKLKKQIIFIANPKRKEKNYELALNAVTFLQNPGLELIPLFDIPNELLVNYYNAADLMLMTSKHEGSPNAIKEAMACNCPIVATDVGDIKDITEKTFGCRIASSFEVDDIAEKIDEVLKLKSRTSGRENIKHLDDLLVASKIINLYKKFKV